MEYRFFFSCFNNKNKFWACVIQISIKHYLPRDFWPNIIDLHFPTKWGPFKYCIQFSWLYYIRIVQRLKYLKLSYTQPWAFLQILSYRFSDRNCKRFLQILSARFIPSKSNKNTSSSLVCYERWVNAATLQRPVWWAINIDNLATLS